MTRRGPILSLLFLIGLSLTCELRPTAALHALFWWALALVALHRLQVPISRLTGTATARSLAWIRIVTCSVLLLHFLLEDVPSLAGLVPRTSGIGITRPLFRMPFYQDLIADGRFLVALNAIVIVALLASLVGLFTRTALPIATATTLILGGIHRDFTHYFHTGLLPWYVLLALCFTPCGDAWSLDARRRGSRSDEPSVRYGAYCYACWSIVALVYLASGLSKLRRSGVAWWTATNLRTYAFQDTLNLIEWFDLDLSLSLVNAPDAVFVAMGLIGVWLELAPAFLLVSHQARRIVPLLIAGLHVGILAAQGFLFLDTTLLAALFLDPTRLRSPCARFEAPPDAPTPDGPRYLIAAVFMTAFISFSFEVERYPFSAWGMYAYAVTSHRLDYQKVYYLTAAGERVRTDLSEMVPALSQGRFFDQLNVFSKNDAELVRAGKLFDVCAARYEEPITAFEVEHWQWSFTGLEKEPLPGRRVELYRHEVR